MTELSDRVDVADEDVVAAVLNSLAVTCCDRCKSPRTQDQFRPNVAGSRFCTLCLNHMRWATS